MSNISNSIAEDRANQGLKIAEKIGSSELEFLFYDCLFYNKLRSGEAKAMVKILERLKQSKKGKRNIYYDFFYNLNMGNYYSLLNDPCAEKYLRKIQELSREIGKEYYLFRADFEMMYFFTTRNCLDQALELGFKILKSGFKTEMGNKISLYNNIGVIYHKKNELKQAIKYFKKMKQLAYKLKVPHYIQNALAREALIYYINKDYEKCRDIYLKLLSEYSSDDYFIQQLIWLRNLGVCYSSMKNYHGALKCYSKYIKISEKTMQHKRALEGYIYSSFAYMRLKDLKNIKNLYPEVMKVSKRLKTPSKLKNAYTNLFQMMEEGLSKPSKPLEIIKKFKTLPQIAPEFVHYYDVVRSIISPETED